MSAADRQLILDPATASVDVYEPASKSPLVDGDERHAKFRLAGNFDSALLRDDAPGAPSRRTAAHKARARG